MIILYGGNGFIGRHIAVAAEGHVPVTVVSADRDEAFFAVHAPSAAFMSLEDFFSKPGSRLLTSARVLVHLANTSMAGSNIEAPWREITQNVAPNFRCFVRAVDLNPRLRIIFPSSGGTVYGEGHRDPIPESAALAPVSIYGLAKAMSEDALAYMSRRANIEYVILRIANPVGRWHRSRTQGLIELAVGKAIAGEPVTIFGDGSHTRDYFDADDLGEAVLAVAEINSPVSGTWNIGSGRGTSILEALDLIKARLGKEVKLNFEAARPWDVSYSVLNVDKARRDFGWASRTPLQDSVDKVVRHLLERGSGPHGGTKRDASS